MNRQEELELTVQMFIDKIVKIEESIDEGWHEGSNLSAYRETAESVLAGQPCHCVEYPFPHKRTHSCFRRY